MSMKVVHCRASDCMCTPHVAGLCWRKYKGWVRSFCSVWFSVDPPCAGPANHRQPRQPHSGSRCDDDWWRVSSGCTLGSVHGCVRFCTQPCSLGLPGARPLPPLSLPFRRMPHQLANFKHVALRFKLTSPESVCVRRMCIFSSASWNMYVFAWPAGVYEALELRDKDPGVYMGKGVLKAVANVNSVIGPALAGKNPADQKAIDDYMVQVLWRPLLYGAGAMLRLKRWPPLPRTMFALCWKAAYVLAFRSLCPQVYDYSSFGGGFSPLIVFLFFVNAVSAVFVARFPSDS